MLLFFPRRGLLNIVQLMTLRLLVLSLFYGCLLYGERPPHNAICTAILISSDGGFGTFCLCSFVEDTAAAFDTILHKGSIGEVYNIGTSVERTVRSVAEDICKHFKLDPAQTIINVDDRPFNDQRYYPALRLDDMRISV